MSDFSEFYEQNDNIEDDNETYDIAFPEDNRLKYLSDNELEDLAQSIDFKYQDLDMLDYMVQREMDRRVIEVLMHIKRSGDE